MLKSFYVDDFVSGKETKPETLDLCLQIRECLAEASFSLHKWACSDPEIIKLLNEKEVNPCCDNVYPKMTQHLQNCQLGGGGGGGGGVPRSECQRRSKGARDKLGH